MEEQIRIGIFAPQFPAFDRFQTLSIAPERGSRPGGKRCATCFEACGRDATLYRCAARPHCGTLSAAELECLRTSVVSLLRDTANYGLRYAPNGAVLLRFVVARVVQADTKGTYTCVPFAD